MDGKLLTGNIKTREILARPLQESTGIPLETGQGNKIPRWGMQKLIHISRARDFL